MTTPLSPSDRFKALAKKLDTVEDEARWDDRLKKVAAQKLAHESEKPE